MKITIVGAGNVGATAAYRIASQELAREVVVVDVVEGIARGKALDMVQAAPLLESDCRVVGTTRYEDTAGSDIVVITAGWTRRPGMTRDDLLVKNADIVRNVTQTIVKHSPNCILIPVSNPLDEMAYVAYRASGFDRSRVIGMAGVLDSTRLRSFIAAELNVGVEDVSAIVIGGQGEGMVPLCNYATVSGIPLSQLLPEERISALLKRTREAGGEIINLLKTGSAYYAPAAAIISMIEAIVKDKHRILPCAVLLDGEYGLHDVVIGVPVKLGRTGIESIIEIQLMAREKEALTAAVQNVKTNLAKI